MEKRVLVVAGASGDLFAQKVAPALAWLYNEKRLEEVSIVGVSRKMWGSAEFQEHVAAALEKAKVEYKKEFLNLLDFKTCDVGEDQSLREMLIWMSQTHEQDGSRFSFYLSLSTKLYETIFKTIADFQRSSGHDLKKWLSIIVEKPYGHDEVSARAFDDIIVPVLGDDSIFRIDHYLTKETIQDILAFRFANRIFESAWDNRSIRAIRIHTYESAEVANRAVFYEAVGALRDVGQNHLLQMLAAVTMNEPSPFSVDGIRSARADIFKNLVCDQDKIIVGQYDTYKNISGIDSNSRTDTFFRIAARIQTPRWNGVSIELSAGKALDRKETYIEIEFIPSAVSFSRFKGPLTSNIVRFSLYPKEEVLITIFGKEPGLNAGLKPRTFGYSIHDSEGPKAESGYAAVLDAALDRDRGQFASSEEIHAAWKFIDSIKNAVQDRLPVFYEVGSKPEGIQ